MDFFFTIWRKLASIFGNIKLFPYPLWFQFGARGYRIKGHHMRLVLAEMQPGDLLLRGYDQYLASRLIGYWSHVAIVCSETEVIHAIGRGVVKDDILDFLKTDRVWILRPKLQGGDVPHVIKQAEEMLGREYDPFFRFNDRRDLSCTELFAYAFHNFKEKLGIQGKVSKIFGEIIVPEDLPNFHGLVPTLKVDPKEQV